MNPSIFVSVPIGSVEGVLQTETVRYDKFVRRLLKGETPNQEARHWALGMLGEIAELFEPMQRRHYYIKELGDFYFYFQCGLNHYGIHTVVPGVNVQDLDLYHVECQPWQNILLIKTGLFTDQVKKHVVYGREIDIYKLQSLADEIAGAFNGMCKFHGTTIQEVLQINAEKLAERYAGLVYSDLAAHLRRDTIGEQDC